MLEVLRSKDFRFLWTARSIHEVSRRMELLVLGYLILRLTDSAFQVGLIAVFLNIPRPVLALFAGLLADRLGPLPVTALRLDHDTAETLARMGLHRIADLIPLPRAPLV